jgi:hypothetical protein
VETQQIFVSLADINLIGIFRVKRRNGTLLSILFKGVCFSGNNTHKIESLLLQTFLVFDIPFFSGLLFAAAPA